MSMATTTTTPEEFFAVQGFTADASPPSPSVFLDLPPTPNGADHHQDSPDGNVLSRISRMLMEDEDTDEDGLLLCQYPDDHSALLLQVQKPFAEIILSSPSSLSTNDNQQVGGKNDEQQCTLSCSSALSEGGADAEVVGAFLKGKEEASRFLPGDDNNKDFGQVKQNQALNQTRVVTMKKKKKKKLEGEVGSRARKSMMMMMMMEEVDEMLDKMMLRGYETCVEGMRQLRAAKADEAARNSRKKGGGGSKTRGVAVDLCALLIRCAQAVAASDLPTARELLRQVGQQASAAGDATPAQRLAHCFARGLEARLAGTGSQLLPAVERPLDVDSLKAYKLYLAACCFNRVALFFNVMTIEHAIVAAAARDKKKTKLHIVDYGPHHGFQWAGLLRWMANRETPPEAVRITAISRLQGGRSCPSEGTDDTGRRLSRCARELGVPFEFRAVAARWEDVHVEAGEGEVLVVNDQFSFGTLNEESIYFDAPCPRDTALGNVGRMRPDVFIQGVINSSYGTSFLARFREALFYYGAMFEMLDATVPREGKLRWVLEQGMMGPSALNAVACEGIDLWNRPEKYRQWQARNRRAGLRQLPLRPGVVDLLKEKVSRDHHGDFFLGEDGHWLLQGWMGRILYAHSTWVAAQDAVSSE